MFNSGLLMCITFEPTKVLLVQSQKGHTECTLTFGNTSSAELLVLICLLDSRSGSLLIVVIIREPNYGGCGAYCNNLSSDICEDDGSLWPR